MERELMKKKIRINPLSRYSESLMCPVCYELTEFKFAPAYSVMFAEDVDAYLKIDISIKCKGCNNRSTHIQLDENIAPIIVELNKKGYFTKFCCEGHRDKARAYVMFQSFEPENLPKGWDRYVRRNPVIDYNYNSLEEKSVALVSLKDWVDGLPILPDSEVKCLVENLNKYTMLEKAANKIWDNLSTEDYLLVEGIEDIEGLYTALHIVKAKTIDNEVPFVPKFKSRKEQKMYVKKVSEEKRQVELVSSIQEDVKFKVFSLEKFL